MLSFVDASARHALVFGDTSKAMTNEFDRINHVITLSCLNMSAPVESCRLG